jgi:glycosyltransferase involved in cell wall biosynthesis
MKFAYFGIPHIGGTYTVFRQLQSGLQRAGVDLRWLGIGEEAHRIAADPAWAGEMRYGVVSGGPADSDKDLARSLLATLDEQSFDGVFVNVLADRVQMNVARYLPRDVMRIMIVHNITPGTYAAARAIRDHVHATVGVSRRIRDDLVGRFDFDPRWTCQINNAVELPAEPPPRARPEGGLRLLFVGRLEDQAKGVLWLPAIMRQLPQDVTLTIAGSGPDEAQLARRCAPLSDRIRMIGRVPPTEVPQLMASHDVLVAPSRFEGLPMTILEAMGMGCVPVTSHLRGVTDSVIEEGGNGLLFPIGDVAAAAAGVRRLYDDPGLLLRASEAAKRTVRSRFNIAEMASAYLDLVRRVGDDAPSIAPPGSLEDWHMPLRMRDGLRTYVPVPVKNLLRTIRERVSA